MRRRLLYLALWLPCAGAAVVSLGWLMIAAIAGSPRAWQIILGYDHVFNGTSGGRASQLVSARAERARQNGRRWGCVLCRWLDRIDQGHCARALQEEGKQ